MKVISVTKRESKRCEECRRPIEGNGWDLIRQHPETWARRARTIQVVCDECARRAQAEKEVEKL